MKTRHEQTYTFTNGRGETTTCTIAVDVDFTKIVNASVNKLVRSKGAKLNRLTGGVIITRTSEITRKL